MYERLADQRGAVGSYLCCIVCGSEMSELDKFFGPKPHTPMPPVTRTHFGRYPDRQEVCDAFIEEMDWDIDPWTIKQVAAGARDFVAVHGNKPRLIRKAIKYLKQNAPEVYGNIASPRSLITTARNVGKLLDPDDVEDRRRYLKGTGEEQSNEQT